MATMALEDAQRTAVDDPDAVGHWFRHIQRRIGDVVGRERRHDPSSLPSAGLVSKRPITALLVRDQRWIAVQPKRHARSQSGTLALSGRGVDDAAPRTRLFTP